MALPKLFQRIDWHNNTTPAINETNLNAMSKGLDDIDDRVISIAGTVMETVPQVEEYLSEADDLVDQLEQMTSNPPYIGSNGNWYTWDTNTGAYVDSGVDASITITVGSTTTLPAGSSASVTNSGTSTDPVFNFAIPQGAKGEQGDGDMNKSTYDPSNTVATAGGIPAYVAAMLPAITVDQTGTASSTGTRYQRVGVDGVYTEIDGTKYMEQTITLSTSASVTATFTNAAILSTSVIEVFAGRASGDVSGSKNAFPFESIYTTAGSCAVTFPKEDSAISLKVRIYIK